MVDLARWLGQQLDEDERIARAATRGPWVWTPETDAWDQCGPTLIRKGTDQPDSDLAEVLAGWGHDAWGLHVSEADQAHIAEWDPARVLREIDAKRRTLIRCEEAMASANPMLVHFAQQTVWEMASVYADRPGFREEWAL